MEEWAPHCTLSRLVKTLSIKRLLRNPPQVLGSHGMQLETTKYLSIVTQNTCHGWFTSWSLVNIGLTRSLSLKSNSRVHLEVYLLRQSLAVCLFIYLGPCTQVRLRQVPKELFQTAKGTRVWFKMHSTNLLPLVHKLFPNHVHSLIISLQPGFRAVKLTKVRHSVTCLRCLFHLYARDILTTHTYPKKWHFL